MMAREALHAFFRGLDPPGNQPERFIVPVGRSLTLAKLISDTPHDTRIMEVGCSVGRNLAYLADQGYKNLEGIEISPHATRLLRETYPQLEQARIHTGAAEDILPLLQDPYDLIFTMSTLSMIHPDSLHVFDEIARLTDDVLAVEPSMPIDSSRHYPHNLPRLFEERGLLLTEMIPLCRDPRFVPLEAGLHDHTAYRFRRA